MLYLRFPGRNSGIFLCNLISSHYLCTVKLKTPRNMKKVISKLDGKEYHLTVCNDESNVMFICNKRYQVRNATSDDCCNPELYCVVNGTFNEPLSDLDFKIASGGLLPQPDLTIPKRFFRKSFEYRKQFPTVYYFDLPQQ